MKNKYILLITCYFFISIKESGISLGVTQAYAGTDFIVIKTKECKPKVPETIGSWMDQAACEFNHSVVKPIQKCYDSFRLDKSKGVACAFDVTQKIKSFKAECSVFASEELQSICQTTSESLQKVVECHELKGTAKESRDCTNKAVMEFHKDIQKTAKSLLSNTSNAITSNPKFPIWVADGNRDAVTKEFLNPSPKSSPISPALKEIQTKISAYTGSGFDGEYTLAVKNDAIEHVKMEEERLERERLERIAQAERERQAKIARMEERKREMEHELTQMRSTGYKTPSKCQQAKSELAKAENFARNAAQGSQAMANWTGNSQWSQAAQGWNNMANMLSAAENAVAIGCVFAGEGDFMDMSNAIMGLNNDLQALKNSGSSNAFGNQSTVSQDDGCIRVKAQCPGQKAALERIQKSGGPGSAEAAGNLEKLRATCAPCGYNW